MDEKGREEKKEEGKDKKKKCCTVPQFDCAAHSLLQYMGQPAY